MKVMKFGGTSVGSPTRIKNVATLITTSGQPTFVVLYAMSGTTNTLIEIADYLYKKNPEGANEVINALERKYLEHIEELYSTEAYKQKTQQFLVEEFNYLRLFTKDLFTSFEEKCIVAQGEIISTTMMVNYLQEQGIKAVLLSALDFMRTDKNGEPNLPYIKEKLAEQMAANPGQQIYLTQGFICRNAYGEVDNLLRGGSDYTASLIGAALVLTRASSVNVEGEAYDSVCASAGRKICMDLEKSTDLLLTSFSITEEDIIAAFNDNHDLHEYSSIEELKCFTALAVYESTKTRAPYTRASALDYVACIGLGQTSKSLFDLSSKQIVKFAAKKLAGRLVPYVGWGWAAASAAYCISRL